MLGGWLQHTPRHFWLRLCQSSILPLVASSPHHSHGCLFSVLVVHRDTHADDEKKDIDMPSAQILCTFCTEQLQFFESWNHLPHPCSSSPFSVSSSHRLTVLGRLLVWQHSASVLLALLFQWHWPMLLGLRLPPSLQFLHAVPTQIASGPLFIISGEFPQ